MAAPGTEKKKIRCKEKKRGGEKQSPTADANQIKTKKIPKKVKHIPNGRLRKKAWVENGQPQRWGPDELKKKDPGVLSKVRGPPGKTGM